MITMLSWSDDNNGSGNKYANVAIRNNKLMKFYCISCGPFTLGNNIYCKSIDLSLDLPFS